MPSITWKQAKKIQKLTGETEALQNEIADPAICVSLGKAKSELLDALRRAEAQFNPGPIIRQNTVAPNTLNTQTPPQKPE